MLNKWIGMGRLTRTPDLKNTPSGVDVATFSMAIDRNYKGQDGQKVTDYVDVVAWRQLAKLVGKYLEKGRMVVVEGSWQMRDWSDREGNKRRTWEVIAENIYFADSRRTDAAPQPAPPPAPPSASTTGQFTDMDDDDGELPF